MYFRDVSLYKVSRYKVFIVNKYIFHKCSFINTYICRAKQKYYRTFKHKQKKWAMKRFIILSIVLLPLTLLFGLLNSCKDNQVTPTDTKYIPEFHTVNFFASQDPIMEDQLALYVDFSTCLAQGMKTSDFYTRLVPSFVEATKTFHSIKGNVITKEIPTDTYNRLLNIEEVNYADLKTAAEQIAQGKTEGALLTDGEYYNPTLAGANPNNPYLAEAFKTWLTRGHDIFILSEPYIENYNGIQYNKKRFYFLFTDTRLKNNIYDRIIKTAKLEDFPNVQLFHLSADHPIILAKENHSEANTVLTADIKPYGYFEIQDWQVDWKEIENLIMGAVDPNTGATLPNGDFVIKDLKVDRNSFGGYKITDIGVKVYDMNADYNDFYNAKTNKQKVGRLEHELPECPNFLMLDQKEFERHGNIKLYFDIMQLDNSFLIGEPFNYFKIDFFITKTENVFSNYRSMFTFDLLGQPGKTNSSVVTSVEQCLVDKDLENRMKHSPIYTIYVKSNQK